MDVLVLSDGESIIGTYFGPLYPGSSDTPGWWVRDPEPVADASAQLQAYAAGDLTRFDLPLRPHGTQFQKEVWSALAQIPYGITTTYGQLARQLGRPAASRAVGAAVGRNPIGIIIPCHRVIGADGSLTGYAGGLDNKVALLELEGVTAGFAA